MNGVVGVRPPAMPPGKRGVLWTVVGSVLLAALPIAVTYRPSFDGTSLVAQFHNTSARYLDVRATFESRAQHQSRSLPFNIGPYQTLEIGWAEGWAFMSGETIALHRDDYRDVSVKVP